MAMNHEQECFCKSASAIVKCAPPQDTLERTTWTNELECCCIYRNCYQLFIELSGRKGSVTYGLRYFSPSLPGDRYLKLSSKRDLRAEISRSIVWYDALAPRPAVLLLWYFVGACAATLELKFHIHGENIHIGSNKYKTPLIYWGEFLPQVDKNFSLLLRSFLKTNREHFCRG